MSKKQITTDQALSIVKQFALPDDYNCATWDQVISEGSKHADGLAVALGIDDEYTITD